MLGASDAFSMNQELITFLPLDEFDWHLESTTGVFNAITRMIQETEARFAKFNEEHGQT